MSERMFAAVDQLEVRRAGRLISVISTLRGT